MILERKTRVESDTEESGALAGWYFLALDSETGFPVQFRIAFGEQRRFAFRGVYAHFPVIRPLLEVVKGQLEPPLSCLWGFVRRPHGYVIRKQRCVDALREIVERIVYEDEEQ
jgi:hypothetical protein